MDQLKAELMKICRERGDAGSHEVITRMVSRFFDELLKVFTLQGVESFSALELREAYVGWVTSIINEFEKPMVSFFHSRPHARSLPAPPESSADNVVSFFPR